MQRVGLPVKLTVPEEMIEAVADIAKKRGIKKSQAYRMLLDLGIDCHRDLEKVGLIKTVDFIGYVKKAVREKVESRQLKLI